MNDREVREINLARKMICHALFSNSVSSDLTVNDIFFHLRFFFSQEVFDRAKEGLVSMGSGYSNPFVEDIREDVFDD